MAFVPTSLIRTWILLAHNEDAEEMILEKRRKGESVIGNYVARSAAYTLGLGSEAMRGILYYKALEHLFK